MTSILYMIGICWIIYSGVIFKTATCQLYVIEEEGNWYVKYEETVSDVTSRGIYDRRYESVYKGPISEEEAESIVKECEIQGNEWMGKYGFLYKYLVGHKHEDELSIVLMLAPIVLFWFSNKFFRQSE